MGNVAAGQLPAPTTDGLVETIKTHIAEGDRLTDRAEQHYRAAGRLLITLKSTTATWVEWQSLLRKEGISISRASELMQIADGRKTLAQIRAETAERVRRHEASSSLGNEDEASPEDEPADNEFYTSSDIIERARRTFGGGIDTDPASCAVAQETVRATKYFDTESNGLAHKWSGRCWLNPPYMKLKKKAATGEFVTKLLRECEAGRVTAALLLTGPGIASGWFHEAAGQARAILFVQGRLLFKRPDGSVESPTRGNVIFYFGDDLEAFEREFADLGTLLTRTEFSGYRETTMTPANEEDQDDARTK